MALYDMPVPELQEYRPARSEPQDFDEFWSRTLTENDHPLDARFTPYDAGLGVACYEVDFAGYGGDRIRGWYLPGLVDRPGSPCVVRYLGYRQGRGSPTQWLAYPAAGFPTLVVETRGQGSAVDFPGATADPHGGTGAEIPGFLTRGIAAPDSYYYRRVYVDAYRAIDLALTDERIAADRVSIAGGSQGGGVGLAVCGLRDDVDSAYLDVPSLAHFRRAVEISDEGSRSEIAAYLAVHRESLDDVFAVLDYFDGLNFAVRASAHANFSAGLMDRVCPPSTIFAAYNHYAGTKSIDHWTFNGHDGGGPVQLERNLRSLRDAVAGG